MTPEAADLIPTRGTTLVGTVLEFDDPRGIGVVGCGGRSVPFHCTAITDGSRYIDVGTPVEVRLGPGRLGKIEATSVRPVVVAADAANPVADATPPIDQLGAHTPRVEGDNEPKTSSVVSSDPIPVAAHAPTPPPVPAAELEPLAPPGPVVTEAPDSVDSVDSVDSWPTGRDSGASAWTAEATPVSGTPVVQPSEPRPEPAVPSSGGASGEPVRPDGLTEPGDEDSSPKPNFWSPFSPSPTGPPPTWSTPVTKRDPSPGS